MRTEKFLDRQKRITDEQMQLMREQLQDQKIQSNRHIEAIQTASENSQNKSSNGTVKLPKLSIEPFFGDTLRWPQFCDTFNTTIHTNVSLTI